MYTCEYMHVYREVLTVSTRNGTHVQVWDCTARVDIQRYLWWNICIFVTYVCMQRGSKCEHSQGHRHMLVRTTRSHTQKYLQYEIYIYLWVDACIWGGSKCEDLQGHTHICEFAEHRFIYKSIYGMICVFLSMYVRIETGLQSVSTCQGRGICEFAEHGLIYKSICDMIYVCLWVYTCIQRGSKCEHSQGHRHMWVRTTRGHMQKFL